MFVLLSHRIQQVIAMRLSKLMCKVVVNTENGEMVGYIRDLEIDLRSYCIISVVVEEKPSLLARCVPWFFKTKRIPIKIENINSIGTDVILIGNDRNIHFNK